MNAQQFALATFVTVVAVITIAIGVNQTGGYTDDAVLCTTAGGTPVRIDGVTHCFSSTIFISTQEKHQ